jgi:hypothetical protein
MRGRKNIDISDVAFDKAHALIVGMEPEKKRKVRAMYDAGTKAIMKKALLTQITAAIEQAIKAGLTDAEILVYIGRALRNKRRSRSAAALRIH